MKTIFTLITALLIGGVVAAPLPHIKLKTLSGTIKSFTWVGSFSQQQESVWPIVNPTGVSKTNARYFLVLSTTNLTKEQRDKITSYGRNANFAPKILNEFTTFLEDDEVIVMVQSERIKHLKVGSKVQVEGYDLAGDEFDIWEKHSSFLIDGKPRLEKPKK
ncbi:hypothetical protein [Oceaniferula spumae]